LLFRVFRRSFSGKFTLGDLVQGIKELKPDYAKFKAPPRKVLSTFVADLA
jgi:hypothetical protein